MLRPQRIQASRRSWALPKILFLCALVLSLTLSASAAPLTTVFVNGMKVSAYPLMKDGIAYLPINAMALALQADISWDATLNTVKINGQTSPATVLTQDGKVYLPIESFVAAIGGTVSYEGKRNAIKVVTKEKSLLAKTQPVQTTAPLAQGRQNAAPKVSVPVPVPKAQVNPVRTATPPVYSPAPKQTGVYAKGSNQTPYTPQYPGSATSGKSFTQNSRTGNNVVYPPSTYTNKPTSTASQIRPADAPPYLASNLQTGPAPGISDQVTGYTPPPANARRQSGGVYVPHTAQNSIFQVTVTNIETISVIKDFYRPKTGYKFVVAYLSQQNISEQVQIYTGRFSLLDQKANSYDYIEGLSNFWLVILRPFGINFGYLVYEIPVDAKPISLVLHSLNQAPLNIDI